MKEYAIYKGDEFLFLGSIEEIMKEFNVKRRTVLWWSYPAAKKRAEKGYKVKYAIKLED